MRAAAVALAVLLASLIIATWEAWVLLGLWLFVRLLALV